MQLAAIEMLAQDFVYPLLPLHPIFAGKFGADNQRLKVVAVARYLQVLAGQACSDDFLDLFRLHHDSGPQFVTTPEQRQCCRRYQHKARGDDCQTGFRRHVGNTEEAETKAVDHIEHGIETRYLLPEFR
jgi:hypothetical protein